MKDLLQATLLVVGLTTMLWLIASIDVSHPDVHKSWSTKECIKVQNSKAHSCENLPTKYNTVWVQ